MKVGLAMNGNLLKKTDHTNSKSVAKNCTNYFIQTNKESKKKKDSETSKKSVPKLIHNVTNNGTNKNILTSSIVSNNVFQSGGIKHNYKSTPETKGSIKINEENNLKTSKDNFYTTKPNEYLKNDLILENHAANSNNNKKLFSNNNIKNANVNLWRKPIMVGSLISNSTNNQSTNTYTTIHNNAQAQDVAKNNLKMKHKSNSKNLYTLTIANTDTVMTNNSPKIKSCKEIITIENKVDTIVNINNETKGVENTSDIFNDKKNDNNLINLKTNNIDCKNDLNIMNNHNYHKNINEIEANDIKNDKININYLTNYNTNINITSNDKLQSEILSSIINFKSLLKTNDTPQTYEKLMKHEENATIISLLNSKLNTYGGGFNCLNVFNKNESLLNENNVINRETFIEPYNFRHSVNNHENRNTFNKINVINANMLGDDLPNNKYTDQKNANTEKMIKEIYNNSNMRIKRYEILLDFISSNIKDINQIINNSHIVEQQIDHSRDLKRIEEVNSNKLSSLHSKINLYSRTNIFLDNEDSELQERTNVNLPNRLSVVNPKERLHPIKNNLDLGPSPSILISSINSEFYQNLLEESNLNSVIYGNFNLSNDMGSFRTQTDQIRKFERVMSMDGDKSSLQFYNIINKNVQPNVSPGNYNNVAVSLPYLNKVNTLSKVTSTTFSQRIVSSKENKINANKGDEMEMFYNEGEENMDDCDLDKTKEHIQTIEAKKIVYNQVVKDMERVKFFSQNTPNHKIIEENVNMKAELKDKTPKSPEEKSSKCVIF